MSTNKIGDEGIMALVQVLTPKLLKKSHSGSFKSRQNLRIFKAVNNRSTISIGNLTHFLKLIGLNETLSELRLGNAAPDLDEQAMKQIAFAIKNNVTLTTLEIGQLGESNFQFLTQLVQGARTGRGKRPQLRIVRPKS